MLLVGVPVLTACGDNDEKAQNVYCVNHEGTLINPNYCDQGTHYYGGYPTVLWLSTGHYSYGYHVPASQRHSFVPNNPNARANAGLPRTGRAAGSTVSHSGGFGHSGGSGSHSGGG